MIIEQDKLKEFEKILGIKIKDYELLQTSLIHRSYLNENRTISEHNERLEFLGDAVLELITTEFLFDKYPERTEGDLTSFRAALVKTESLAETAEKLKYGEYIFMSRGEEATGGRSRPYILANTYEAVLGYIYLDQGYTVAKDFVEKTLLPKADEIVAKRLDIDSKSQLQELAQEILRITPTYEVLKEEGPDHEKTFTLGVMIGDYEFGSGSGASKQEAAQAAAAKALQNWEKYVSKYFK
jgi:ribonuclease-3